jgi:ubiquinone/menaquinone biosynthesis C-methylase UbiE
MKYQDKADATHCIEENLRIEADAHDDEYEGRTPFGLGSLTFTKEQVWRINDHSYKSGTYRRGWRKRRLFELMDLGNLGGQRVLEVGCGQGHNSVFFAMYGAEVYGFDLSSGGIRMARRIAAANGVANRCHFAVASASNMPYPDEHYDAVVYNATLHHAIKYPNVVEETRRVLKTGGRLFFAEGIRENSVYRLVRSIKKALHPIPYHGDIDLETEDIDRMIHGYTSVYVERFCLIEKFAQGLGNDYDNNWLVRAMYFGASQADRILLRLIPSLRRQCLEIIGVAVK